MESIISFGLIAIGIYLLFGLVFSILFLWKGIAKVDPGSKETSLFFKLLILPGLCVFWILFLKKWKNSTAN